MFDYLHFWHGPFSSDTVRIFNLYTFTYLELSSIRSLFVVAHIRCEQDQHVVALVEILKTKKEEAQGTVSQS
jgi:hypothetical protein